MHVGEVEHHPWVTAPACIWYAWQNRIWYKQEGNLVTILEKAQRPDTDFLLSQYSDEAARTTLPRMLSWRFLALPELPVAILHSVCFPIAKGTRICTTYACHLYSSSTLERIRVEEDLREVQPSLQTRLTVDLQKIYTKSRAKIDVSWWCPSSSKKESSTP